MTANNKISKKKVAPATSTKKTGPANGRRRLSRSEKKREQAQSKAAAAISADGTGVETHSARDLISPAAIAQFLSTHASSRAANRIAKILATTTPLLARLEAKV
jgi:hypothetical protein